MSRTEGKIRYLSEGEFAQIELAELLRVIRLCDPDFDCSEPMTFNPVACLPQDLWRPWLDSVFGGAIAPFLIAALHHGRRGEVREMAECDHLLSESLPASLGATSREAGRALLHGFIPPAGERVLRRLQLMERNGETPGNFAIVFAARCSVFNIPIKQAVFGYLYKEWQAGAEGMVRETSMPDVNGVFDTIRRMLGDNGNLAQGLHVVSG